MTHDLHLRPMVGMVGGWSNSTRLAPRYVPYFRLFQAPTLFSIWHTPQNRLLSYVQTGKDDFGTIFVGTHTYAHSSTTDSAGSTTPQFLDVAIKKATPTALDLRGGKSIQTYDEMEERCHEIKALMRLQEGSPMTSNIQYLYEYFMDGTNFFMVTERLGPTLEDWRSQCEIFTEKMAVDICRTILQGLVFCESRNVIHRSVKLQNIQFREPGNFRTLKLVGFAMACTLEGDQLSRDFCGSLGYIAPEIYLAEPYGYKVDMFSFGVLLFRLLSGDRPFSSTDTEILRSQTIELRYNMQREDWASVSHPAKDLVCKLLVNSTERLTAEQALNHRWLSEIGEVEVGPSLSPPPPSQGDRHVLSSASSSAIDDVITSASSKGTAKTQSTSAESTFASHSETTTSQNVRMPRGLDLPEELSVVGINVETISLREAVLDNNLARVRLLIQQNGIACAQQVDEYGANALHHACRVGNVVIVQYFVEECHVNVEATDNLGFTALHVAASSGHPLVRNTTLYLASQEGHLVVVQYLIESHGANVSATNTDGSTALHLACRYGCLSIVQYLVERCQFDIETVDPFGFTGLLEACYIGHLPVVQYLLESCMANVNASNVNDSTALHLACDNSKLDVVRYLVETCGVNLQASNKDGSSALHRACSGDCDGDGSNLDVIRYLVETCQVDIDAKDHNHETALDLAQKRARAVASGSGGFSGPEQDAVDYLLSQRSNQGSGTIETVAPGAALRLAKRSPARTESKALVMTADELSRSSLADSNLTITQTRIAASMTELVPTFDVPDRSYVSSILTTTVLGRGFFGTVLAGHDRDLNVDLTVKAVDANLLTAAAAAAAAGDVPTEQETMSALVQELQVRTKHDDTMQCCDPHRFESHLLYAQMCVPSLCPIGPSELQPPQHCFSNRVLLFGRCAG